MLLTRVLNTILPSRCALCRDHLEREVGLCARCADRIGEARLEGHVLHLGEYRGHLERAAQALKFAQHRNVAVPLASRLAAGTLAAGWAVDAVVPVPLHAARQLERGYNQAQVLAEAIGGHLGKPVIAALGRRKRTVRQARLPKLERAGNVRDAFTVTGEVRGLELLLVDDVLTTGATITEATLALIGAGAKRVRVAVISRAMNKPGRT